MPLPDAFNTDTPAGQLRLAVRVAGTELLEALLALKPAPADASFKRRLPAL